MRWCIGRCLKNSYLYCLKLYKLKLELSIERKKREREHVNVGLGLLAGQANTKKNENKKD